MLKYVFDDEINQLRVRDLKEGDIAIIDYNGKYELVYVFMDSEISMVSLSSPNRKWSGIRSSTLVVKKLFKKGEKITLEVV